MPSCSRDLTPSSHHPRRGARPPAARWTRATFPAVTRVGLTGGVASGKSTVSAMLAELGAVVIDADALAREVVEKGTAGLAAVVAEFGAELLTPDGDLDRPAMGRLVFGDDEARRRLEAIVHPLVFERIVELEEQAGASDVVVHDIPLLAESGRADTFDAVIVVDAPREVQLERMVRDRDWTREDAESRIAAQASRDDRLAIATHVIDNTGTLEDLRARVAEVYADLARRAA
jgi:dephospho-CoA kinase